MTVQSFEFRKFILKSVDPHLVVSKANTDPLLIGLLSIEAILVLHVVHSFYTEYLD